MVDILIIGSGGAGLTAALEASKLGAKVKVISKTFPTHSQTVQAQGGINAVLYEGDSVEEFTNDTFTASKKLGVLDNIEFMCTNSKETISWLSELGVPFSIKDEKIAQRKFGGAYNIRTCYSSDYTGLKILHTLYDTCIKEGIEFINEHLVLNLITEDKKAVGVTAYDMNSGEVVELLAKSVILATGGYSGLFTNFTTNSYASTGDGLAMAIRAGAKLSNMEFMQFHPTTLKDVNILISESARGEGGYLVDSAGDRFIDELKPRDEVARAIYQKLQEGSEVYLDLRHLGVDRINEIMPQERLLAKEFSNISMENELLPIAPAAHYSMGGVLTNKEAQTSIENLYACGECAQAGIHGANRLGGNSLLEIITFGKVAGKNAFLNAQKQESKSDIKSEQFQMDKRFVQAVFNFPNKIDFYEKKDFMGKILFKNVGLFRTDLHMKAVLSQLRQWQKEFNFMGINDKSRYYNKNFVEFIEFGNMLELAEVFVVSAISRCESRGSHYRTDHPKEQDGYLKNSISYKVDGVLAVDFEDVK